MASLYPRISEFQAEEYLNNYSSNIINVLNFDKNFNPQDEELDWLPLGERKTIEDIHHLRNLITTFAGEFQFPKQLANRSVYTDFDRKLAEKIYKEMLITPSIAADTGMWTYLNVMVIPDVIEWRWSMKGQINRDRYYDKIRNYLGSLWWSYHIFMNKPENLNIYQNLSADEFSGLMERTATRGLPNYDFIIASFCHENINSAGFEFLFRQTIKYINAELAYKNYFCLNPEDIIVLCQQCLEKAEKLHMNEKSLK